MMPVFDKDLLGRPLKASPETGGGKCCIICNQYKYLEEFDKHTGHKDNRDGRCRECKREQTRLRKELARTAPPKPDTCECCGKTYETRLITLDHCHETNVFRGWICHYCNAGIGQLGDNIEGLEKALDYLRRHYASI